MRDGISIGRAKLLHPKIAGEVQEIIDQVEQEWPQGIAVRIVQGLRTFEQQEQLYQLGRTVKGVKVTNAKPGSSYHQYGLAIDFAILYDKDHNGIYEELSWDRSKDMNQDGRPEWDEVVKAFEGRGYSWGGRWRTFIDYPHLEKTFGYNWRALLVKYQNREFLLGTKYVIL